MLIRELLIEKFEQPTTTNNHDAQWKNKHNQLHRENGLPAIIWADGQKEWHINGKFHRDGDKPAVINYSAIDRTVVVLWWGRNGRLHRENGKPAKIYLDGRKEWWINGKFIKKNY